MTSSRAPRLRHLVRWSVALGVILLIAAVAPSASAAPTPTTGLDVRLPIGHQIRGVVTSPTGDPIAGANVEITSDVIAQSAVTAANGAYVVHAVPDGTYRVSSGLNDDAFLPAYYGIPDSTPDSGSAALVEVAGNDVAGIDIRLIAPATTGISGTVRDPEGRPVAGIEVLASGPGSVASRSTADGTYRIPRLPTGDYTLFVTPPDSSPFLNGPYVEGAVGAPDEEGTVVTVGEADTTGIDIEVSRGGSIRGRVTTARAATIEAFALGPTARGTVVAPDGSFTIQGLPPGDYQVLFRDADLGPENTENGTFPYGYYGPGGSIVGQDQALSIGVTTGTAQLAQAGLKRGTDIVGRVTDGRNAVGGAFLFVCDANEVLGCAAASGAADGSFRVVHVPTGRFTIEVAAPGRVAGFYVRNGFTIDFAAAGTVSVVSGKPDVTGVEVALPAGGSVAGRIRGPSGEPIAGAGVSVFPFGVGPGQPVPTTDATGRFRQTGIPTNVYGLSVRAPEESDYLSGYYLAGAPRNYSDDFAQATSFRVVEGNDRQAPTITFRDPAPSATGVFPDASISVRFSEPVDGITTASLVVRDPKGRIVPAAVSFDPQARTATLVPNEPLQVGTRYRVTVTNAVADWSGNRFGGASWSFDTTS